jgi:hypothetical protein
MVEFAISFSRKLDQLSESTLKEVNRNKIDKYRSIVKFLNKEFAAVSRRRIIFEADFRTIIISFLDHVPNLHC